MAEAPSPAISTAHYLKIVCPPGAPMQLSSHTSVALQATR